jgi:hypothetical protein
LVSLVIKTFGKVLNGKPCRAYADMRCVGRSKIFLQTFPLMYRYLLTFSVIFVNLATFLLFIPRHSDIFADYQDNLPINPKTICRINQTFAESVINGGPVLHPTHPSLATPLTSSNILPASNHHSHSNPCSENPALNDKAGWPVRLNEPVSWFISYVFQGIF